MWGPAEGASQAARLRMRRPVPLAESDAAAVPAAGAGVLSAAWQCAILPSGDESDRRGRSVGSSTAGEQLYAEAVERSAGKVAPCASRFGFIPDSEVRS